MNKPRSEEEVRVMWVSAIWAFIAMAVAVLMAVIITSTTVEARNDNFFVPQPPARFDYLPVNYKIRNLPIEAIRFTCFNRRAVGCSIMTPLLIKGVQVPCMVLVPNDAYLDLTDQIIRHEFGHCNGWHKSHPK